MSIYVRGLLCVGGAFRFGGSLALTGNQITRPDRSIDKAINCGILCAYAGLSGFSGLWIFTDPIILGGSYCFYSSRQTKTFYQEMRDLFI